MFSLRCYGNNSRATFALVQVDRSRSNEFTFATTNTIIFTMKMMMVMMRTPRRSRHWLGRRGRETRALLSSLSPERAGILTERSEPFSGGFAHFTVKSLSKRFFNPPSFLLFSTDEKLNPERLTLSLRTVTYFCKVSPRWISSTRENSAINPTAKGVAQPL